MLRFTSPDTSRTPSVECKTHLCTLYTWLVLSCSTRKNTGWTSPWMMQYLPHNYAVFHIWRDRWQPCVWQHTSCPVVSRLTSLQARCYVQTDQSTRKVLSRLTSVMCEVVGASYKVMTMSPATMAHSVIMTAPWGHTLFSVITTHRRFLCISIFHEMLLSY